ncbi:hypothetical protein [Romboutsia timonensis]|nr:hypothetical protein [Romboutsia timonensis]MDY3960183.1 hypothetical protein [Romboutsia timonensis]
MIGLIINFFMILGVSYILKNINRNFDFDTYLAGVLIGVITLCITAYI